MKQFFQQIFFLLLLCLVTIPNAWAAQTEERILKFPADVCYGQLIVLERGDHDLSKGGIDIPALQSRLGAAQGVVCLKLQPSVAICLDPNYKLYKNPAALKLFPAQGIDSVRVRFIAQDDAELIYCDRLLSYLGHLQSLTKIKLNNSDVSDKGLASIGPLPHLRDLQAGATSLTGRSLPVLAKYPALEEVALSRVNLSGAKISDLSPLKHLETLNLHGTRIGNGELKDIGKISSLKFLKLDGNAKLDDRCLADFHSLKALKELDITGTNITAAGVAAHLKGLPLHKLFLNASHSTSANVATLRRYPNAS